MPDLSGKTPVTLITGFLGSGKTTLISRLLQRPELGDTAVIVNELGEVGIDHHLLRRVDERTVLLDSGCVCCTLRGDLADELRDLDSRRARGEIPAFRRVVVETTGLADPAPIVYTLAAEPVVRHHFELERDRRHRRRGQRPRRAGVGEAGGGRGRRRRDQGRRGRPGRRRGNACGRSTRPPRSSRRRSATSIRCTCSTGRLATRASSSSSGHPHEGDIRPFCLFFDEPLDWTAFGIWLTMLLQARGSDLLRVKGLIDTGGPGPVLLNGVQHVVHPPEHLDAWPDDDRRSRLVFIGRGLERAEVERSLLAFDAAANYP